MERFTRDIISFLEFAGVPYVLQPIEGSSFLPGLKLEHGTLIIDTDKLLYPGDILHEAGHLATASPDVRKTMNDALPDLDIHQSGEMMAMAWSYAACLHIGISPEVVFHPYGYRGGSKTHLKNFAEGRYVSIPMLEWTGMAYDKKKAAQLNVPPFPHMIKWLRET